MKIRCYNFKKRHNDTLRPTGEVAVEFDVYVKRNTSVNNPIFLLDIGPSKFDFNYIYWVDMNMYYWVDDVVYGNDNIKEVVCSCDALATTRDEIVAAVAFVKYSSLNYDPYINDDRIKPTSQIESVVSNNSFQGMIVTPDNSATYCYVLTTVNNEGVTSYVVSRNTLEYIGNVLIDHADDIIGNMKEFFTSAKDSILRVQCIPWSLSALQGANLVGANPVFIKIGAYDTRTIEGYLINSSGVLVNSDFVDIPSRPDNFTRIEPYCEGKIHIPLLGTMDLSLSELQDVNKLYFRFISNVLSGETTCILFKGDSDINKAKVISTASGNVNFDLPIGAITQSNPTGLITGIGSLLATTALASTAAAVVGGIAAAVASFASYFSKTPSSIGGFSGNASAYDSIKLSVIVYKHGLTEDPADLINRYGGPCGKVLPLSSLVGGYVQTSQFELISEYDAELVSEVNRLLDSGIYLT